MSFISVIKKIGSVALGIEHIAEPVVETLFPVSKPIFDIFDKVSNTIVTVEANMPGVSGPDKSQAVISDFEAGLALTQQILALEGKQLTYDKAALQTAINAQVAAYNAFAAVKTSFKVTTLPVTKP